MMIPRAIDLIVQAINNLICYLKEIQEKMTNLEAKIV